MSGKLRELVDRRKSYLIHSLIAAGIYKKEGQHLFEWTLTDLEKEYSRIKNTKE
ncbi:MULTISPECIES: Fur-regulated basic protein FbpA [Bacillaceae]|uniref:Fur-regulated basic protein FbpA n=1 Tax=Bacillaceae TaxID=186817 RepID=UPI001E3736E6|nr:MULTISPECIES: Fur-regulated basic protein FbpA [Bacillaceae]MCE4048182.1 Fur-regulated basic protein FbpA [Bacillus sp. Au-Bac7]MCM3033378.1 Fur-regulated basic protein FbpA [Niallia sp. MER 6]MDL0434299.1 Fur-regulated basic protein FbpA [Niallia sp. SS-2023]UPO89049.1 Fur-regulated basic protein FbpA [Niallia sp. Man26]